MEREPVTVVIRGKQSKLPGGSPLAIGEQLGSGITNEVQIANNAGLLTEQTGSNDRALTGWKVKLPENLPQREKILWKDLEQKFKQENDDKKLQDMLDEVPISTVIGYIGYNKHNHTPVSLDFLRSILRAKGLHIRSRDAGSILAVIKDAGIPIKREHSKYKVKKNGREHPQTYYIIIVKHTDRILEALRTNPELFARLNDNPVKLAYGPNPDRHPNTTRLVKKTEYARIGNIITEHFGIVVRSSNYSDLLAGSPVSIFSVSSSRGYFCSLGDLDILLPFLEQRLKDLEKIK